MTLAELSTPFERHRIIHYAKDGNKAVRHWYEMQRVVGPLYKSRETKNEYGEIVYDTFLLYDGARDGLLYEHRMKHPEWYTIEKCADSLKRYGYDSLENFIAGLDECAEQNRHIGNAQIEFTRQIDVQRADRYALHRAKRLEEQERKHQALMEKRAAEREEKEKHRQAELDAERAKLMGWAKGMTAMQFGRVSAFLGKKIHFNGMVMTRREFIIDLVHDGWTPQKKEGVVTYYSSKWGQKESAPKTVYQLSKDHLSYTISKTEYDFALYLAERKAA